jgi:ABC-type branched-subunit amino acid transport system ATPase component
VSDALVVDKIVKRFGNHLAVDQVSFTASSGRTAPASRRRCA